MVSIQRSNQDFIVKLRHPRLNAVAVVVLETEMCGLAAIDCMMGDVCGRSFKHRHL